LMIVGWGMLFCVQITFLCYICIRVEIVTNWRGASRETGLVEMIIPASVEVLGFGCFYECRSLSFVTFESGSRLHEVGQGAFFVVAIRPTLIDVKIGLVKNQSSWCSLWIFSNF
jgi:hypothetical protein